MNMRKKAPTRHNQNANLTLPPAIKAAAKIRGEETFGSLSGYIAYLIMQDLTAHGIDPAPPAPDKPEKSEATHETKLHEGQFVMKDPAIESRRKTLKKSK